MANCSEYANCSDIFGSYTCTCNPGFSGDGFSCISKSAQHNARKSKQYYNNIFLSDINECAFELDDCHPNATCIDTFGSYECACNSGFIGNGISCDGKNKTSIKGSTVFMHSSYAHSYYTDVDECFNGAHNCHSEARCLNRDGGFSCMCNSPAFVGNGTFCEGVYYNLWYDIIIEPLLFSSLYL